MKTTFEAYPKGWMLVNLSDLFITPEQDIVDGPFGSNLKASEYVSTGIPLVRLQNIGRNQFVFKNIQYVTEFKAEELSRHSFVSGDLLITKLGDPLGEACIVPANIPHGIIVADLVRARITHDWVDPKFLCYQINSEKVIEQFKSQTKGTTRPRVNLGKIRQLKVWLAPKQEQHRIVEKLEELLSELDAGVAELKTAKAKLALYRKSLLKSAVEGQLTQAWREKRIAENTPLETGEQLLQRILKQRRQRWEEKQFAKFKEQGKLPPNDWRDKYPEPIKPNTSGLPKLPKGWTWATVDQLTEIQGGIQKQPARIPVKNHFPFLRVANVLRGLLDLTNVHRIELFEGEVERLSLKKGDVLVVEGNGSISEIGRCAVWEGTIDNCVHQNHLIRLRPIVIEGKHLAMGLNSLIGQNQLTKLAATTSGLYTLSISKIANVCIPLAGLDELSVMMDLLDSHEREAIGLENQELKEFRRLEALKGKILMDAFQGNLVPQSPADESASQVLEYIRQARTELQAQPKPKRLPRAKREEVKLMKHILEVLPDNGQMSVGELLGGCGLGGANSTAEIEMFYISLRDLLKQEKIQVVREDSGDYVSRIAEL